MLKTEELKAEIRRMCEEKGAIILAHYYTIGDIQDIFGFGSKGCRDRCENHGDVWCSFYGRDL